MLLESLCARLSGALCLYLYLCVDAFVCVSQTKSLPHERCSTPSCDTVCVSATDNLSDGCEGDHESDLYASSSDGQGAC